MRIEHWFYTLPLRWRSLFRRAEVDRELNEELQEHLEQQIQENLSRGMSPEEAGYAARRAFGGVTQVEEDCREARRLRYIDDLGRDSGLPPAGTNVHHACFCPGFVAVFGSFEIVRGEQEDLCLASFNRGAGF